MDKWITVSEAAEFWSVPKQQVTRYCRDGRIEGAKKDGHAWLIPADTQKPEKLRKGRKMKIPVSTTTKRPLPIGVSDFRVACDQYYYIDKTMLIKDFIDERPIVSLFTRPRRFGKTLTMDMLRTFFEKTDEDTSAYFKDKKIWSCGKKYRDYQGKYPVIFITLSGAKALTYKDCIRSLRNDIVD